MSASIFSHSTFLFSWLQDGTPCTFCSDAQYLRVLNLLFLTFQLGLWSSLFQSMASIFLFYSRYMILYSCYLFFCLALLRRSRLSCFDLVIVVLFEFYRYHVFFMSLPSDLFVHWSPSCPSYSMRRLPLIGFIIMLTKCSNLGLGSALVIKSAMLSSVLT